MARALEAGVHHVEFDLRLTRDKELVALHDPHLPIPGADGWAYVDELDVSDVRSVPAGAHVSTFEDLCRMFSERALPDTTMHVDVKIDGQEGPILQILQRHGLLDRCILVSWLPSVLFKFHGLAPSARLCFSHLTLSRAPWLFPLARAAQRSGVVGITRALGKRWSAKLGRDFDSIRLYVHGDGDPRHDPSGDERLRSNPGHLVRDAVRGDMRALLRSTRGLVCIPARMATRALAQHYREDGIGLAVFSAKSLREVRSLVAAVGPDIIYVDAAAVFSQDTNGGTQRAAPPLRNI